MIEILERLQSAQRLISAVMKAMEEEDPETLAYAALTEAAEQIEKAITTITAGAKAEARIAAAGKVQ